MRHLFLVFFLMCAADKAHAVASIFCSGNQCVAAVQKDTADNAVNFARNLCTSKNATCLQMGLPFQWECRSVYSDGSGSWYQSGTSYASAQYNTKQQCSAANCKHVITACDTEHDSGVIFHEVAYVQTTPQYVIYVVQSNWLIFLAAIIAIAAAAFTARGPISNFIIHGNLPYKLPVYGEDIQCLIKRTQRVNWYGRVVFGIVVNLAMTHQQLIDIRKYWLGRVIAFDSLRRQRQNELARMHLQLAASVKSDPHDKKKFWSRRWATFRTFIRRLFWIFTALFSFLFGFLFIRITIAKMVRGTIIESNDLVLILQAKDAIEESTTYLKEYLTTANTFDGGDEIYEPE
jgi:hypothetical protein